MKFYRALFWAAMLFFTVHLWFPALSFSCQPCRAKLNFQETVKRADLIIIGKKVADEGPMVRAGRSNSLPEGSKIKIFRVLKGKTVRACTACAGMGSVCRMTACM